MLSSRPAKQIDNNTDDEYFQRYKLPSTVYRLSAFLGWLELYRQEITFLHSGKSTHAKALEEAISRFRGDLADGQLNVADDWEEWRDTLVFREELRAIGESLIESRGTSRTVMGYGRYCEQFESDSLNIVKRWSHVALNFFLDLEAGGKDFRETRLKRVFVHLVQLILLLNEPSLETYLRDAYSKLKPNITDEGTAWWPSCLQPLWAAGHGSTISTGVLLDKSLHAALGSRLSSAAR